MNSGPILTCHVPFEIRYFEDVDVNGFDLPRSILKFVRGRYKNACYHFSGNGAIGFNLLHKKMVDSVHFVDIYQPALDGCKITAGMHGWSASFSRHLPDDQFDLYIADPPWLPAPGSDSTDKHRRCLFDQDWHSHKEMFSWLPKHLTSHGDAYIFKCGLGIENADWYDLIPPTLRIQDEFEIKFFKSGHDRVRIIDRGRLVHLKLA